MSAASAARDAIGTVVDRALDLSVVGGYSRIGYAVRHGSDRPGWREPLPRLDGRVVIVTGGSAGLGRAAATALSALGATVWIAVRDEARGERAASQIAIQARARAGGHGAGEVVAAVCDLSSRRSVRSFVSRFREQSPRLDVLVNNAGVMPPERSLSVDGIELTLATNVIGPFLLTGLLLPMLVASGEGRVVNVSSGGMYGQKLDVRELLDEPNYSGVTAYARTKRAEVVLTELCAAAHPHRDVVFHAMHPGWAATGGVRDSLPRFYAVTRPILRTPEQGADTIVWLAAADEPGQSTGEFWQDRARRPTHLLPGTRETEEQRRRLAEQCILLSGVREGELPL